MILLDTGPIVAFFDASDHYHDACIELLKTVNEPILTTWPVLTEAFYILGFSWNAQDFRIYKPARIKNFTLIPARI